LSALAGKVFAQVPLWQSPLFAQTSPVTPLQTPEVHTLLRQPVFAVQAPPRCALHTPAVHVAVCVVSEQSAVVVHVPPFAFARHVPLVHVPLVQSAPLAQIPPVPTFWHVPARHEFVMQSAATRQSPPVALLVHFPDVQVPLRQSPAAVQVLL
jgi:hypothetical protein